MSIEAGPQQTALRLGFVCVYVGLQSLAKLHPHRLAIALFTLFGLATTLTGPLA